MYNNLYLHTSLLLEWSIILPLLCVFGFWMLRKRQYHKNSAFFNNFYVGGHRGSPINKPENTIASMEQAKLEGTDLVEFDVSLTKDGIAVLLHDDTLDRTTNLAGPIRQKLYKELQMCNCAAKFHSEDSVDGSTQIQSLPTLEQMVKWAIAEGQKMLFDVKDTDSCLVLKLEELFDEYQLYDVAIVCSFWPTVVYRIKQHNSRILTGITWRRGFFSFLDIQCQTRRFSSMPVHWLAAAFDVLYVWSIKSWLPAFLGVDMVLTERNEISENFVRRQEQSGRKVCAWTVNDLNEMVWMRKTLKIPFLTDKPFLAKKVAGQLGLD